MQSLAWRLGLLAATSTLGLLATVTCGGSADLKFTGEGGEGGQGGSAGEGGLGGDGSGGGSGSGGVSSGGAGSGGAGSGGDGSGGDGSGGGPAVVCGDGEIGGDEECDQSDLRGETCASRGYTAGRLSCNEDCQFDESNCTSFSFEHVFTSCGTSGQAGPTLEACRATYDTDWDEDDEQFTMLTQGYQLWTVPEDGTYRIEASGAQGGDIDGENPYYYYDPSPHAGGLGARVAGDFALRAGQVLTIVVGQKGDASGGGGGTFVVTGADTPLLIAGGGAGASARTGDGAPGSAQLTGSGSGGAPIIEDGCGTSGGGGFLTDGSHFGSCTAGSSFLNGSTGGTGTNCGIGPANIGGFGGGGGSGHAANGGGGGGYDGGHGGWVDKAIATGGTSYNAGTNQAGSDGVQAGHGQVTVTFVAP